MENLKKQFVEDLNICSFIAEMGLSITLYQNQIQLPGLTSFSILALVFLFLTRGFYFKHNKVLGYIEELSYIVFFYAFGRNCCAYFGIGSQAPIYLVDLQVVSLAFIISQWARKAIVLWKEVRGEWK